MNEYIHWNGRLFRRESVSCVYPGTHYDNYSIHVLFNSSQEHIFGFEDEGQRDRLIKELMQKIEGTWLEDDALLKENSGLDKVLEAWNNPGPVPEYHRNHQQLIRRGWPVLGSALDEATRRNNA